MPAAEMIPRWVRANGLDFAVLEAGEGPLVLCLHGFPDTAWNMRALLLALANAGYRAVAPFTRGYAPTSLAVDDDYRTTTLAKDALALIDALGEKRAFIVGHDWGAATAYLAAAADPQKVRALVTAAVPHLRRFLLRPTPRQLYRSSYMAFFQLQNVPERRIIADDFRSLRALIQRWSPGWKFTEEEFAPLKSCFADPARLSAALKYYRDLPRTLLNPGNRAQIFGKLLVPARVIRGADDGCIGAEMFEDQDYCFGAGYELVTMKDAGHFMQCEQPQQFAAHVIAFLDRQKSK